ncbi:MAG: FAD-dependent oxidoreductase [Lachnospiraceae bacterium]|nr:FAD-dependent oxidoreductase [Lachnospiraceae bacterium]
MDRTEYDLIVIGGGPAGLSAAAAAYDAGERSILVLERDTRLGGILNQCIHNGFGLHTFQEELTGPEYAQRYIDKLTEREIEYKLDTMVMSLGQNDDGTKTVTAVNETDGLLILKTKALILAMGCRERSRGSLNIPGFRPAGIFSAGTAQRLVNIEGYLPGRRVVILGSGDIGLIMARRMTLEGAKVLVCAELMPYSGGLKRNIVQCLDDFGIPLKLSHTVVRIEGKERVEGVVIAEVGPDRKPIPGTEEHYDCDTLLLSVGLLPENELTIGLGAEMSRVTNGPVVDESLETSVPGVFAAGNVLHVHDLVDYVSEEAAHAGESAAAYIREFGTGAVKTAEDVRIPVTFSGGIRYTVPAFIDPGRVSKWLKVRFRVGEVMQNKKIVLYIDGEPVMSKKRRIMAPGEMEELVLTEKLLQAHEDIKTIDIRVEEDMG